MGFASFLEDIEKRLDDSVVHLSWQRDDSTRGMIGIESLRSTNDLLRQKNEDLIKLFYTLRAEISSKKQTDFCNEECIRLRKANATLTRRIQAIKEDKTSPLLPAVSPEPQKDTDAGLSQKCWDAKQRYQRAIKAEIVAKQGFEKSQKARAKAQSEYTMLIGLWRQNNPSAQS